MLLRGHLQTDLGVWLIVRWDTLHFALRRDIISEKNESEGIMPMTQDFYERLKNRINRPGLFSATNGILAS